MTKPPLEIGRVALSMAGRDAGRRFLVIGEADEEHVLIVDGDLRKVEKPKKKKRKHLKGTQICFAQVREKLTSGGLKDHEVRRLLAEEPKEEG